MATLPGKSEIEPEEIAWYTPMQARVYAEGCVGSRASNAILQLLASGLVQAQSANSSVASEGRAPIAQDRPGIIPKRLWKFMSDAGTDLWSGGYARFWVGKGADGPAEFRHFGIKLNRNDLHRNLPRPPPPRAWIEKPTEPEKPTELEARTGPETQPPPARGEEPEPEQRGPPVSPDHLTAWFDLYRQAYSGSADTEANALASARGMFPGRSVPRDRIRELRGSQKRGRKNANPRNK
jgi:hypothetical protein